MKKILIYTMIGLLGLSSLPFIANAGTIVPEHKIVKCGGKTFVLMLEPNNEFSLMELSKPTTNSNGLSDHTNGIKTLLNSKSNMKLAQMSCAYGGINLAIPEHQFSGTNISKGSYGRTLNLLVTSSGRVMKLGYVRPVYPINPRYPDNIRDLR